MHKIKICLVTVIYKRHELTDFVLSYYNQQKDRLKDKIEIELVCVGSEGNISQGIAIKNGFEYHEYPNTPVSHKHNKVVEVCKNKDVDGIVYVGSDDIIDDVFFDEYIKCINQKIDFLGFTDVYFLTENHLGYWGGYKSDTPRYNEPIGPGKFYSKKLLDKLNWKPWGNAELNRGLDRLCWNELNSQSDITKKIKKCTEINGHIIDIKTETNITNINDLNYDYEFGLDYIHSLNFDYSKIRNILKPHKTINYDLSIVISTFNNKNFLTETLNSIYNSIGNRNVEILIGIDKCEETLEFVRQNEFTKNTIFFYFEENLGPYIVFNSLVEIAKSENILFFGSDDVMNSSMIENTITGLKKSSLFKTKYKDFKNFIGDPGSEKLAKGVFGIKKDLFLFFNGFEPWRMAADNEFITRLTNNNVDFETSTKLDFFRRLHPTSLTNSPDTGLKSEKRKEYHKLISEKTDFGPLKTLHTHEFKLVTPKGNINYTVNKNNSKRFKTLYDLSILISTFDNLEYISECFESIKNNLTDYTYEVLIGIDNCEKTLQFVKNNEFPDNFRFYYFEQNHGPYIVFNTLSNLSSSNQIMFFGSDDIMIETLIEKMILNLQKYDCVRCSYVDFKDGDKISKTKTRSIEGGVFGIKYDTFNFLGGFRPWRCEADSEFITRLQKNNFKLGSSQQLDFYRRVHKKGLTSKKDTGYSSTLRKEYKQQYINEKKLPPLELKVVANYTIIKEGKYDLNSGQPTRKKNTNTFDNMFNRVVQVETKNIDYEKVNVVVQDRQIQKEKTHSRPERPVNENSNANAAKRAVVAKKPVKPVNSSPNSKIGKDFLRI